MLHASLTTQGLTEEYFDLEARLDSARKLEERLHELLQTEAKELKDLLEVERELARSRETIERFEGKLRLWEQQVALSTLTVQFTTRQRFAATEPLTLGEQVGRTISNSWEALITAGRTVVLVLVAVLPWILPLVILVWLGRRLVRRLERGMARRAEKRRTAYTARVPVRPGTPVRLPQGRIERRGVGSARWNEWMSPDIERPS